MIIGWPNFNQLGVALSTMYLCVKYPLPGERVGVVQGDHEIFRKCYVESLKSKRVRTLGTNTRKGNLRIMSPREAFKFEKVPPLAYEEIEDWNSKGNSPWGYSFYCLLIIFFIFNHLFIWFFKANIESLPHVKTYYLGALFSLRTL